MATPDAHRALPAEAGVVVIGAGFSGLGAAIRLARDGADVLVLERAAEIGGAWRRSSASATGSARAARSPPRRGTTRPPAGAWRPRVAPSTRACWSPPRG